MLFLIMRKIISSIVCTDEYYLKEGSSPFRPPPVSALKHVTAKLAIRSGNTF